MFLGHHLTSGENHLTGPDINQILGHHPAQDPVKQRIDMTSLPFITGRTVRPFDVPQSIFVDDTILCNIDKTTGQITRIRRFQRGIGKSLTRAVGRVEIFQNIQTLL